MTIIEKAVICRFFLVFFTLLPIFTAAPARADDGEDGRLNINEENDRFGARTDRHYTQGMHATWLTSKVKPDEWGNAPFNFLAGNTPIFSGGEDFTRKYNWTIVGQSIFTPANIAANVPSSKDRPYGAWLYTGGNMLQETRYPSHDALESMELLLGVVGPMALGAETQNDFHQFIGVSAANGWHNQLHNEPGLALSYGRKWRFETPKLGNFGADVIPEAGVTLGNIFTYGDVGGMVRFGQNLRADYGPNTVRPSNSGNGWFNRDQLDGRFGWYFFAGAQGRAVGHNIFLDGNTWRSSDSVEKKPLVADTFAGVSLFWSQNIRMDFTLTQRTKEFTTQQAQDRFGSVGLVIGF